MRYAISLIVLPVLAACSENPSKTDGGGADAGIASADADVSRDASPEDAGRPHTGTVEDAGEVDEDASVPEGVLTAAERAAIDDQVYAELEQMGLLMSTAKDSAMEHTIVIRLPFRWSFFTNDMICAVTKEEPDGCRSGTSRFNPNFAFPRFEPEVAYAYEWAGQVGTLTGTIGFTLTGTPTYWLDEQPLEPNEEGLVVIRAHVESATVTEADGGAFAFERSGLKDFDIVRPNEPLRMRHTDITVAEAVPFPGGVDVQSMTYEATFTDLRSSPVEVTATIDAVAMVTGEVRYEGRTLATLAGAPFAMPPAPLSFDWAAPPAEALDCTPACGARTCGLDPICGTDCGACAPPDICSPSGDCEAP